MATTAKNREENEDAEEEVIAPLGWRLRAKSAITRILLRELDRAIGVMQRARAAVAPADETSEQAAVKAAPVVKRKVLRPLAIVMLSLLLLAIATAAGAGLSYRVFAQRLEKQADVIADKTDEALESDKESRKAELALDKAKIELKEARQTLEENEADLQQTKIKLAEFEGRALLYGNPRATARPNAAVRAASAAASETLASNERAAGKRSVKVNDGSCQVGSGSIGQDLSRCLGGH